MKNLIVNGYENLIVFKLFCIKEVKVFIDALALNLGRTLGVGLGGLIIIYMFWIFIPNPLKEVVIKIVISKFIGG